jgi:hypothetical protein
MRLRFVATFLAVVVSFSFGRLAYAETKLFKDDILITNPLSAGTVLTVW